MGRGGRGGGCVAWCGQAPCVFVRVCLLPFHFRANKPYTCSCLSRASEQATARFLAIMLTSFDPGRGCCWVKMDTAEAKKLGNQRASERVSEQLSRAGWQSRKSRSVESYVCHLGVFGYTRSRPDGFCRDLATSVRELLGEEGCLLQSVRAYAPVIFPFVISFIFSCLYIPFVSQCHKSHRPCLSVEHIPPLR